jgi:ABC-type transport system involved in multi-copper enzyme maturation permease subunit
MSASHFLRVYLAESLKTFTRGSGKATLGLAVLVALFAVAAELLASRIGSGANMNGQPLSELVKTTGSLASEWALVARNFYLLPMLLLWCAGASFASELKDHTLRELALRPVHRVTLLMAKLASLATLSLATLLITGLLSALLGVLLFGHEGEWGALALGYLLCLPTDLGLLSLGVLSALLFRSETGTVVGVVLFLMADLGLRLVLKLVGMLGLLGAGQMPGSTPGGHWADSVAAWMPGQALSIWEQPSKGWTWEPFAALVILLTASLLLSSRRIIKIDIP